MNSWLLAVVVVAVVTAVVVKRLRGEPLNVRDLLAPPLVLIALGVFALVRAEDVTGVDFAWLVPGLLLGIALGALRGATVRVFARDGVLWQRYTGRTFLVLVVSFLLTAGYGLLASRLGMHEQARPAQLGVGVGFLGEALVVGLRGLATGVPFAPER